nr:hypothetical protein FVER53263_14067 [Fusarium verticillioides]
MSRTPRTPRDYDSHFRGYKIERVSQSSKRVDWETSDLKIFYCHMARYQITSREDLQRGFDELTRNLGIMDRSESYKKAVMDKALSSMHYHVTKKFREPRTQVLVPTTELDPAGDYVWKWPRYSLQWLRDDWGGDLYLVLNGEDCNVLRSDLPG